MSFLVISCSLNPNSRSRVLARAAFNRMVQMGVDAAFIDLQEWTLPLCDGVACYESPQVQNLARRIHDAEAILLATPIYNYDVNAAAKNLVELTGSAWEDKVVAFVCAAGGRTSYMSVMSFANSLMLDYRCVIVPRFVYALEAAFRGQEIADEVVHERLRDVVASLIRFSRSLGTWPEPSPELARPDL